ncbi:NADPH-dependent 7-cyano-7-deazaguanine reductase QueF [Thiotrichales bacterium 19S9-12]|nr:NADPH-dependent 7-cyano-7-deazaguanine reductase QueF [Thiotrichales bacterium 19S9-11]MCF6811096.1 NADPH-dependent 7-cyano-7-deazaguanine reductase QueF [Thiotrichales bacterium 19S9-12]
MNLNLSELGKKSTYKTRYDKSLLFSIPRQVKRDEINIKNANGLFFGYDIWTAFEVSWLNLKGKPVVKIIKFIFDSNSKNIVESKSFKLYLNSLNQTQFDYDQEVVSLLEDDLRELVEGDVTVNMYSLDEYKDEIVNHFDAKSIDHIDCQITDYQTNPSLLKVKNNDIEVTESLTSHLLKSNCLVTGQPDWGSILIQYTGNKISQESLLKYLVSFRNHDEFHEQCVERIFKDISDYCQPKQLLVYARYTRRGGLDINPLRSNVAIDEKLKSLRLNRQ